MNTLKTRNITAAQLDQLRESTVIPSSRMFTNESAECGIILDMDSAEDDEREEMHRIVPNLEDSSGYYHFY